MPSNSNTPTYVKTLDYTMIEDNKHAYAFRAPSKQQWLRQWRLLYKIKN